MKQIIKINFYFDGDGGGKKKVHKMNGSDFHPS